MKVEFEDGVSERWNGGAKGLGQLVHFCDTTIHSLVSRWTDLEWSAEVGTRSPGRSSRLGARKGGSRTGISPQYCDKRSVFPGILNQE